MVNVATNAARNVARCGDLLHWASQRMSEISAASFTRLGYYCKSEVTQVRSSSVERHKRQKRVDRRWRRAGTLRY